MASNAFPLATASVSGDAGIQHLDRGPSHLNFPPTNIPSRSHYSMEPEFCNSEDRVRAKLAALTLDGSCSSPVQGCFTQQMPAKVVLPANMQALIPSKFKYKFPREQMPRHKSYEVLAVEDNPNAPPLPGPLPKKPHLKKSIFGIPKRNQDSGVMSRFGSAQRRTIGCEAQGVGHMNVDDIAAKRGWMQDFKCFLCTSPDFVSEEQARLELENAELDQALVEFQDSHRIQAIQLLEAQKTIDEQAKEAEKQKSEVEKEVSAVNKMVKQMEEERARLLEKQRK